MDGGAWWAAVHEVAKSRTGLSGFTFTFHFHALEKAMATHSSILAWRIPGTREPGGLPSRVAQSRTRLKRLSSSSYSPWSRKELDTTERLNRTEELDWWYDLRDGYSSYSLCSFDLAILRIRKTLESL